MHQHHVFDWSRPRLGHVSGDALWFRKIGKPESEIEKRIAVLKERAPARFSLPLTPALLSRPELVLSGAHADHVAKLATLKKASELLDVAAEPVIVADNNLAIGRFRGVEYAVDAARCERERTLAKDVDLLLQRTEDMRLVKMIRCRYHDCIELVRIEQLVDVGEDVRDIQTPCERAGLWTIVVADRDEMRTTHSRQERQMRKLCNRPRTYETEAKIRAHQFTRSTVVPG